MNVSRERPSAFSLVEITLALGVAGFCLIVVFSLLPVGMQTNQSATSQTAASGIIAALIADLRMTPKTNATSSQFGITFGTETTLYFNGSGQASTAISSDSRYRLRITFPTSGSLTYANVKVTWPAAVDPSVTKPGGSAEMFAAFDRT